MNYEDFKKIAVLYTEAENAVKRYERITDDNLGFVIERLNEATRFVLSACRDDIDEEESQRRVLAAESACNLALCDARRGAIAAMFNEIDAFWKSNPPEWFLNEKMPEWSVCFDDCINIRKRWHDDVGMGVTKETWEQAEDDYRRLQEIRRSIAVVSPALYENKFNATESKWRHEFKSAKEERRRCQFDERAKECCDDIIFVLSVGLALAGMIPTIRSTVVTKGWQYGLLFLSVSFAIALVLTSMVFCLLWLYRKTHLYCVSRIRSGG